MCADCKNELTNTTRVTVVSASNCFFFTRKLIGSFFEFAFVCSALFSLKPELHRTDLSHLTFSTTCHFFYVKLKGVFCFKDFMNPSNMFMSHFYNTFIPCSVYFAVWKKRMLRIEFDGFDSLQIFIINTMDVILNAAFDLNDNQT